MDAMTVDTTDYTVSSQAYFLGTAALLNSLRLTGNEGQVVVLDAGLMPEERAVLEAHTNVVSMRRLLFGDNATLRLQADRVPMWLGPGLSGRLALPALGGVTKVLVSLVQQVADPIRERLRGLRREVA